MTDVQQPVLEFNRSSRTMLKYSGEGPSRDVWTAAAGLCNVSQHFGNLLNLLGCCSQ